MTTPSPYEHLGPSAAAALEWLDSPDAAAAARRELLSRRLVASLADDLVAETRFRLLRTAHRQGGLPDDRSPVAYARVAMKRAAYDVLRSARREGDPVLVDHSDPAATHAVDDDVAPDEHLLVADLEEECRRGVTAAMVADPLAGAAALAFLTLARDVPAPEDAPAPDAEGAANRSAWAALWLAGWSECFGGAGSGDAAVRKQRSRGIGRMQTLLRRVASTAQDRT